MSTKERGDFYDLTGGEIRSRFAGVIETEGGVKKEFLLYRSSFEAVKESTAESIGEIEAFESTMKDLDVDSPEYRDRLEKYEKMIQEMRKLYRDLFYLRSYIIDLVHGGPNAIETIDPVSKEKNRKEVFKDFEYNEFLREIEDLMEEVDSILHKPSWMIENGGDVNNISDLPIEERRAIVDVQYELMRLSRPRDFDPGLGYQRSREGKDYIGKIYFEEWIERLKSDNMSSLKKILDSLREIMSS